MTRSFVTLAFLAAVTCGLAASNGSVGGTPDPATSSAASSDSGDQSETPLAGMSPCKILDKALTGQGFPAATPAAADPEHACTTDKPQFGTAGLLLQDDRAINDGLTDPSKTRTGTVHSRAAILEPDPLGVSGDCAVIMEVKPKSRAMVSGNLSTGTTDQACDFVRRTAEAVEPLLP